MSERVDISTLLGEALLGAIRQAVREEIQAASNGHQETKLLTPEELADRLNIPSAGFTSRVD